MARKDGTVTAGSETPDERRKRLARERVAAWRARQKAMKQAHDAASVGDVARIEELQQEGVPVFLGEDLAGEYEHGRLDGFADGLRQGFTAGRTAVRVLSGFVRDDWMGIDEDAARKWLREHPQAAAVVTESVISAGVTREDWLLWRGKI